MPHIAVSLQPSQVPLNTQATQDVITSLAFLHEFGDQEGKHRRLLDGYSPRSLGGAILLRSQLAGDASQGLRLNQTLERAALRGRSAH